MTGATARKLQAVKQLLLDHGWKVTGESQGEAITRSRPGAPDDGQHMETKRTAGRVQFRLGRQSASLGPGTVTFWRWSPEAGKHDFVRAATVRLVEIQKVLDVRSPLRPEQLAEREKARQERLIAAQTQRTVDAVRRR